MQHFPRATHEEHGDLSQYIQETRRYSNSVSAACVSQNVNRYILR